MLRSNQSHIDRAVALITASGARRVGLAGLSFKPGTDDLRESPLVLLAARLGELGVEVRIHDPGIDLSRVTGVNREYLEAHLPQAPRLLVRSLGEMVAQADLVVIGHIDPSEQGALGQLLENRSVLDLAGLYDAGRPDGDYRGICW